MLGGAGHTGQDDVPAANGAHGLRLHKLLLRDQRGKRLIPIPVQRHNRQRGVHRTAQDQQPRLLYESKRFKLINSLCHLPVSFSVSIIYAHLSQS